MNRAPVKTALEARLCHHPSFSDQVKLGHDDAESVPGIEKRHLNLKIHATIAGVEFWIFSRTMYMFLGAGLGMPEKIMV
jgi:hypothetical protein